MKLSFELVLVLKYPRRENLSGSNLSARADRESVPSERKEREFGRRGGQDASETVVRSTRFLGMGPRTRVVLAQNARSLLFFILCNLTPPTKPSRRERERDLSTSAGFYRKYPYEKGDLARQRGRSSFFSMDPHNRRGSASFSTFHEDQPGSRMIVIFQLLNSTFLSIRDFEGTPFTNRGTCPFTN